MRISFDCAAELYDSTRGPPENAMQQLVKTLINELKAYGSILDAGLGLEDLRSLFRISG